VIKLNPPKIPQKSRFFPRKIPSPPKKIFIGNLEGCKDRDTPEFVLNGIIREINRIKATGCDEDELANSATDL
jgi:hypothetical protein